MEMVTFKHPHTGDVKVVPADPKEMMPLMGRGYEQLKIKEEEVHAS